MAHWIGEAYTSDAGPALHERLVDVGNRLAGSDGERRGAEAARDALADAGARNARLEEFDLQGWERGDSAVRAGEESFDGVALPRSPAGEATGELVDLGYGLPEEFAEADVAGKVVVVDTNVPDWYDRFVHRREKYYYAVDGGAAAFLFRNHVPGALPPTGSVGTEAAPIGDVPAVGVSKEGGARLARRFEGEAITVDVDADAHEATSQNVHAELGPDTEEAVYVTSHVDAHDIAEGALDNGAGTAVLAHTAAALAEREDDLETRVEFVAFGAEEVGLVGSERHAAAGTDDVKAVLNNDGSGRARDLRLVTNHFGTFDGVADAVADRLDEPIDTVPRLGPHSDHWPFVKRGVPGAQLRSVTGNEGRGWGHTYADTYDKVDSRDVRSHAILCADLAVEAAREDVTFQRKDDDELARRLEEEDLAAGMKVIGDWPYGR